MKGFILAKSQISTSNLTKNKLIQTSFSSFLTVIAQQLFRRTYLGGCFCDKFAANTITNKRQVRGCDQLVGLTSELFPHISVAPFTQ